MLLIMHQSESAWNSKKFNLHQLLGIWALVSIIAIVGKVNIAGMK
jgi:uncharacterized membrane protein